MGRKQKTEKVKMLSKKKSVFSMFFVASFFAISMLASGCRTIEQSSGDHETKTNASVNTYVVTVGMEYSKFAGSCPGAGIDASRMNSLLRRYSSNVVGFASLTATKENVVSAIKDGIAKSDLFIFYYSGHGGSGRFEDTGVEEEDGKDEFYCLYDTYLRDNEMWDLIKNAKCRVLIINDCCHSKTLFRQPSGITFRSCIPLSATHTESGDINMQCWSGCPDDTYSYGSATGGQFTNTLLKYFDSRKTYDYLWTEIENDTALQAYEMVQRTVIGSGFDGKPIFK